MYGFSQWGLTSVDLGALGSSILSTIPGGGYDSFSGTSMATLHVAGVAALVLSVNPDLTTVELKELLMNSGDDNADLDGKTVSGKRLSFKMSVTPGAQTITAGATATYTFSMSSIADWSGDIAQTLEDSLGSATLSASTVTPGEDFTLNVPTTGDTSWGSYN